MAETAEKTFICPICEQTKPMVEGRLAELVHGPAGELIRQQHADWDSSHIICNSCLHGFRTRYVAKALEEQRGELSNVENAVIESLQEQALLSRNMAAEFETKLTFGERIADKVASFGGSWHFIIIFGAIIAVWIGINSVLLLMRPFDPYPFILLNLVLSCLAALQAPIIMMSQNRQESKDRQRSEHDYQVNLKAEIEIRQLHIKLDQLINHSWQRLLEIQQVQTELMEEMVERRGNDQ
jgi:uncharacterized membrane protein